MLYRMSFLEQVDHILICKAIFNYFTFYQTLRSFQYPCTVIIFTNNAPIISYEGEIKIRVVTDKTQLKVFNFVGIINNLKTSEKLFQN